MVVVMVMFIVDCVDVVLYCVSRVGLSWAGLSRVGLSRVELS